ncbi:XAC2610-related protein [Paenibacillus wynnii]|uniref:XAC2610-related protein n=1 Tax=Paenibacillus wynnii TaxID=268407 RepID=UPI0027928AFC|nr:hypothetical protein [Paenibacillus wynnii]MDQ0195255.1 hypothetical protein [Paenibacillus wynnii]
MRTIIIAMKFIISTILFCSCTSLKQQETIIAETNNSKPSIEKINEVYEIRQRIHADMPEFTYEIFGYRDEILNHASKIVIFRNDSNEILQQINFEETETPDDESFGFVIEDMNFDGYLDIRIQIDTPAAPNISYYCWIWDRSTSRFIENLDLESITSPEFDSKNKIITSFGRASAAEHFTETYKYMAGIPTLMKKITEIIDDKDIVHYIVEERLNNKIQVTKKYDEPLTQ